MEKELEKTNYNSEINLQKIKDLITSIKIDKEQALENLINERFNGILKLRKNWDDNDAETFQKETTIRVRKLLENIFQTLWDNLIDAPFPLIQPVPDGSIDINWETDIFELLINIPSNPSELINFYGEKINHPEDEIEVRINYDLVSQYVIPWLTKVFS